jgi:two-component system nitrogen regulation response regulator GlnG
VLLPDFLPNTVRPSSEDFPAAAESSTEAFWNTFVHSRLVEDSGSLYDEALAHMETEVITRVLRHTAGNQVEAARILGITRTTLRTKIKQHGIEIERVVHHDSDVVGQDSDV